VKLLNFFTAGSREQSQSSRVDIKLNAAAHTIRLQ